MTQATRHTPGLWTYLPDSNIVGAPSTWHDEDGTHCDLRYPRVIAELPDDWDQSQNGPLIAAAPAMLAALEAAHGFVIWAANHGANEAACVAVEAMVCEAIAQAKGERA